MAETDEERGARLNRESFREQYNCDQQGCANCERLKADVARLLKVIEILQQHLFDFSGTGPIDLEKLVDDALAGHPKSEAGGLCGGLRGSPERSPAATSRLK